jgi:hypothetical protein
VLRLQRALPLPAYGVTNVGTDRSHLANMAKQAKSTLEAESLDVVADRGYFNSAEILACAQAGVTVTLRKPMTSGANPKGDMANRTSATTRSRTFIFAPPANA